jgi:hypothetical protein
VQLWRISAAVELTHFAVLFCAERRPRSVGHDSDIGAIESKAAVLKRLIAIARERP